MTCKDECPKAPHYHIDGSGPICDGTEPHPDWCIAKHFTTYLDKDGNFVEEKPDTPQQKQGIYTMMTRAFEQGNSRIELGGEDD